MEDKNIIEIEVQTKEPYCREQVSSEIEIQNISQVVKELTDNSLTV